MVYREEKRNIDFVICGRKSPMSWNLPKGTPVENETREQTAVREVQEETGLEVKIEGFINSIKYWFVETKTGDRFAKTVFFYLMSATGGSFSRHDHEFDKVIWSPSVDTLDLLTYQNEVRIVEEAFSMVTHKTIAG